MKNDILCIGEILWDSLPLGLFLGGAPFNVATHLHRMGEPVQMISCVGEDILGEEAIRRMVMKGMSTELVQRNANYPTGFVKVVIDDTGQPEYTIVHPAAWDAIALADCLVERALESRALVFGSLAQRASLSRETIEQLYKQDTAKVLDINLRKPYDSQEVVEGSLRYADFVKLNDDELDRLSGWFDLPTDRRSAVEALVDRFGCETVCVTRGAHGAVLLHRGHWVEDPGFPVQVADTVGAGDAFLARLLSGLLDEQDPQAVLEAANRLGAFVATRLGATPEHDRDALAGIQR